MGTLVGITKSWRKNMEGVSRTSVTQATLAGYVLNILMRVLVVAFSFLIGLRGGSTEASDDKILRGLNDHTIIFVFNKDGNQEICAIDLSSMAVSNLTDNRASDVSPSWWPQRHKVVFASSRSGQGDIYTMNPDGSDPKILVGGPNTQHSPVISPDGNTLAYVELVGGEARIRLLDISTGKDVPLIVASPASNPAWSPDGTRLSFDWVPSHGPDWLKKAIYMAHIGEGATSAKMVSHVDSRIHEYVESCWHPDGKTVIYVTGFGANRGLYSLDLNTGRGKTVSEGLGQDRHPCVSLDGKTIACVSNLSESNLGGFLRRLIPGSRSWNLVLVGLDTLKRERIVSSSVGLARPVWVRTVDFVTESFANERLGKTLAEAFHFISHNHFDKAEPVLQRAIELDANNPIALNNLGAVLAIKGNLDKARECFKVALNLSLIHI